MPSRSIVAVQCAADLTRGRKQLVFLGMEVIIRTREREIACLCKYQSRRINEQLRMLLFDCPVDEP